MSSPPRSVFISYAHEDGAFVNDFAAELLRYDMNVWKDSKDIPIGGNIPKNVYEGIKSASHFCCVISSHSVRSRWVEEELSFARMRQLDGASLAIVPILIDAVEIPDYVKVYRCAHLENRDLSMQNTEMLMVLKAFGTDLQAHLREIITGPERRKLWRRCDALRYALGEFRSFLGRLQAAHKRHGAALMNRGYDRPPRRAKGDRYYRPTTHGSDYRIREAKKDIASAMEVLKRAASTVRAAQMAAREALHAADPDGRTRLSGLLHLDLLSYMTREIARAPADGHAWWVHEKLSEWVHDLPREEASVEAAMALLRSWASFDPPGDVDTAEDDDDLDVESGDEDFEEEDGDSFAEEE